MLQFGALAVGALAVGEPAAHASALPGAPGGVGGAARTYSFDENWLFLRGDVSGGEAASFDDRDWRLLDVPHDWSIEDVASAPANLGGETADPSIFDYTTSLGIVGPAPGNVPDLVGPFDRVNSSGGGATAYTVGDFGWYRKHFKLSDFLDAGAAADPSQHVELRLDGVYEVVDVWLNGQHLAFHPNGYTPIVVDLTAALDHGGDNVLAVRVNNSGRNSRWYAGSGIYRHTWLTITGPVRVPTYGIFITTPSVTSASADVHVQTAATNLGQDTRQVSVQVTVMDPDGHPVATQRSASLSVAPGATASFDADLSVHGPQMWSPGHPHLYTARVDLDDELGPADSDTATFGIRSIDWNGTSGFLLNGEPTKLRGANIHASNGPMGAITLGRSEQRRIEILKAAGFNAIRTAHNPPSPELLNYCDQLGMLVWDEFSDIWDAGKNTDDYHVYFPEYWPADLTLMITRDRNHPSVIIWSMGNEIQDTTNGQRGAQMKALIQTLDTSRPITQGATPHKVATDPDYQYTDVSDFHYDINDPSPQALHTTWPNKAVTQSESWPASIYDNEQLALQNP
ncbi:MAG: glycoside hydrolase family 2, partial [Actinobacteria bacterium]|nr:glycoside hydrolase family 2 [Actinomycetota bacterium]